MKDKVENVAILSMSDKEIGDALKIVSAYCLLTDFDACISSCLLYHASAEHTFAERDKLIMLNGFCLSVRLSHAGVC